MSVLALIPARSGSKGIPNKNFRALGGVPLVGHAVNVAVQADVRPVVSSDVLITGYRGLLEGPIAWIHRPAELAQDDTPMIEVVKHALSDIPGPPEQIIVLLQPTQPFRMPTHVQMAIHILQESGADSVVSVTPLPLTHSPDFQCRITKWCSGPKYDVLAPIGAESYEGAWDGVPTCRQSVEPTFIRDGTVYAFWRKTVERYGTIYGQTVKPLIIPPEDTCELDTEADWADVERRWKDRHAD
jgi:CMP-N,N'-diacetyllegionaminic acid synthase